MRWKLESGKKKIVKRVQRYSKSSKEFKDIKIHWKDTWPNKWNLESWKGKIFKSKKNQRYWKHAKPIIKTVGGGNQSKVFKDILRYWKATLVSIMINIHLKWEVKIVKILKKYTRIA